VEFKSMSVGCFHTLNVSQFLAQIEELHGRVSQGHGRIELTRDGCNDVCVLISKAELDALERALEILSQTDGFAEMSQMLNSVASGTIPSAVPPAV